VDAEEGTDCTTRACLLRGAAEEIERLCDELTVASNMADKFGDERDEARHVARWLYESDGDAHDKQTALERWPWIDREEDN
jgi:hypothetical protein